MRKLKLAIAGGGKYLDGLYNKLLSEDIPSVKCRADALDVQMIYLTERPAAIFIENSFDYREVVDRISRASNPPQIYILANSFDFTHRYKVSDKCKNVRFISENCKYNEIINLIKLNAVDVYKDCSISEEDLCNYIDKVVHTALCDLGFTANYTGVVYLKKSLSAICNEKIKTSDSMCNTVYPYLADSFEVSTASVERSIRTAIRRCWNNADDSSRVKYFGFIYLSNHDIPTNREFIMILGDSLLHEIEHYKSGRRIDYLRSV